MSDLPQALGRPNVGAIRIADFLLDFSTLTLNDLCAFEETFGFGLEEMQSGKVGKMILLRFLAWRCLRKQDKSLSIEDVGELVSLQDLEKFGEQVAGDEKGGPPSSLSDGGNSSSVSPTDSAGSPSKSEKSASVN